MRGIAQRLIRLEKKIAVRTAAALPEPVLPQRGEVEALVRPLAECLRDRVEALKKHLGLSPEQAVAEATALCLDPEGEARRTPPDQVSWRVLETLYRTDPAVALEKFVEVKEAAKEELRNGSDAADAVQPEGASPWWLARFFAVREQLAADLQHRGGREQLLIDTAAQTHTLMRYWMGELNTRSELAVVRSRSACERGQPTLDDAKAINQAAAMVERFHAMFMRTIKALGHGRRGHPAVVVGRADQVNVGQQQMNLNAAKSSVAPAGLEDGRADAHTPRRGAKAGLVGPDEGGGRADLHTPFSEV
jgi:hypothetical protein